MAVGASEGTARIRISADVDPTLASSIDRAMARAQTAMARRIDAMGSDTARLGDGFDRAFGRMQSAAERANRSLDASQRAQRRVTDASDRHAAATERLSQAQDRAAQSATASSAQQARAHQAVVSAMRDRERVTRQLAAAQEQAARAADRAAQDRGTFDRARSDVLQIRARLDTAEAEHEATGLRARLRATFARDITQDVDLSIRGLPVVARAISSLGGLVATLGTVGVAAGAGVVAVAGLATAIGTIVSAAAAASLALPGIFAGLGVIVGTVALGFSGLGDAVKKSSAAQAQAGAAAEAATAQQAAHAKAIASAQRQVEQAQRGVASADRAVVDAQRRVLDSQRGVTTAERALAAAHQASERAQRDLTAAREDYAYTMRDLNRTVAEGALDERAAQLALEDARAALASLGSDGQAVSDRDRRAAQLAVDQAEASITRIRDRNADAARQLAAAQSAGIEGDARVVAARDAVASATQGVADAQQGVADANQRVVDANDAVALAQQGVGDAMARVAEAQQSLADAQVAQATQASAAATAATDAMSKLSAAGQAVVGVITRNADAFLAFRNSTQQALLEGVDQPLQTLIDARLPGLQRGFAAVAAGLNVGLVATLRQLSSGEAGAGIDTLLGNAAISAGHFGAALAPIAQGLLNIFAVGSDYLPGLTDGLGGAAQRFLAWSTDADAVHEKIDAAIAVLHQLGDVGRNVGAILHGVFDAASISGGGALNTLRDITGTVSAWVNSVEGQNSLVSFFGAVREAVAALAPLVTHVLEIIGQISPYVASFLAAIAPYVDTVLTQLGIALGIIGPQLGPIGAAFGQILAALAPLLPILAQVVAWLAQGLAPVLSFISPVLGPIVAGLLAMYGAFLLWQGIVTIITALRTAWMLLNLAFAASPIGFVVTLIVGLVAALIYAYFHFETFRNVVDTAFRTAGVIINWAWENMIKPVFQNLWAGIQLLASFFTWLWQVIIVPAWNGISAIIGWAWTYMIAPTFSNLWAGIQLIASFFTWLWQVIIVPAWNGMGSIIRGVWDTAIRPAFDLLRAGVSAVGDGFSIAVNWIDQQWNRLVRIAAVPAKFVVDTVYNHGIREAWNAVAGWLNLPKLGEIGLGGLGAYARGGILPGHTPGRDIYHFVDPRTGATISLGGGEGIANTALMDSIGHRRFNAANAAAFAGDAERARAILAGGPVGVVPAAYDRPRSSYLLGGAIDRRLWEITHAKFPGLQLTSALRPGDPGYHGRGMAVDVSDGYDDTPLMQAAARYWHAAYGSQLRELIHWPTGPGWTTLKNGRPLNYGAATNSEHRNHVHIAADKVLGDGEGGDSGGLFDAVLGFLRDRVADAVGKVLDPIGRAIPTFGGGPMGEMPRKAFDHMKDKVVGFLRGKADEADAESTALGGYGAGAAYYVSEIVRAVKVLGMDKLAAVIAVATALVESNLVMYAGGNDPQTLAFPHEAVGWDHDSSGLFQQRNNGAWGTAAERMNPFGSAVLFLRALKRFAYWAMDPGSAAQRVQGSAYPGRYAQRIAEARGLVDPVFDSGGLSFGRGVMLKDVIRPERVLSPDQTDAFDSLVASLKMSGSGSVSIGGLDLRADGSVHLSPRGGDAAATGRAGAAGKIDVHVTITADTPAGAAQQFADRLTSLITT